MKIYKKLLVIPIVIIIVSLYYIGLNMYARWDRVDEISDAVPATALTEEQENAELSEITDKININAATESELMLLDGIGEVMAERIIELRTELGGFSSIEQLLEVKGIGESLFEGIREYVTVE